MRFILFSKHLEHLSYEELADTIAGIGLDGVDLTVRSPGHVLPENVKTDPPQSCQSHPRPGPGGRLDYDEHLQCRRASCRGYSGDCERPGHHAIQAGLPQV